MTWKVVVCLKKLKRDPLVEQTLKILNQSISLELQMHHSPPHRVSWTLHSGNFFKQNSGAWMIEKLGENKTEVSYSLDLEFKGLVPSFVVKKLMEKNLTKLLQNLGDRLKALNYG